MVKAQKISIILFFYCVKFNRTKMIYQINDRFKFYLIIYENVNFIMASE